MDKFSDNAMVQAAYEILRAKGYEGEVVNFHYGDFQSGINFLLMKPAENPEDVLYQNVFIPKLEIEQLNSILKEIEDPFAYTINSSGYSVYSSTISNSTLKSTAIVNTSTAPAVKSSWRPKSLREVYAPRPAGAVCTPKSTSSEAPVESGQKSKPWAEIAHKLKGHFDSYENICKEGPFLKELKKSS